MEYALNERKSSRSNNEENLRSILGEAMNQDRTEQDLFQSALGCTLETPLKICFTSKSGGTSWAVWRDTTWCRASPQGKSPRS